MRLIQCGGAREFMFKSFEDDKIPSYAILSHTWGSEDEEVLYDDLKEERKRTSPGFMKLRFCATQAAKDSLRYFWVDTCCINKLNFPELQQSILSMYRWYQGAAKCYVLLSDVSHANWKEEFASSRWFTRGWTLQELLAPKEVEFFSKEGKRIGDKSSLETRIRQATRLPVEALRGVDLSNFPTEQRISWARLRQTKLPEDKAYCLLGILDVAMPIMYGIGQTKALALLQREVAQQNGTMQAGSSSRSQSGDSRNVENNETPRRMKIGQTVYLPGFGDAPHHWTPTGILKCRGQGNCPFCS